MLTEQRLITMSESELKRIKILRDIVEKRLKQKDAAKILNLGKRQIIRLVEKYRQDGESVLVSKRRSNPVINVYLNIDDWIASSCFYMLCFATHIKTFLAMTGCAVDLIKVENGVWLY